MSHRDCPDPFNKPLKWEISLVSRWMRFSYSMSFWPEVCAFSTPVEANIQTRLKMYQNMLRNLGKVDASWKARNLLRSIPESWTLALCMPPSCIAWWTEPTWRWVRWRGSPFWCRKFHKAWRFSCALSSSLPRQADDWDTGHSQTLPHPSLAKPQALSRPTFPPCCPLASSSLFLPGVYPVLGWSFCCCDPFDNFTNCLVDPSHVAIRRSSAGLFGVPSNCRMWALQLQGTYLVCRWFCWHAAAP